VAGNNALMEGDSMMGMEFTLGVEVAVLSARADVGRIEVIECQTAKN
jgi:hypothetical protein